MLIVLVGLSWRFSELGQGGVYWSMWPSGQLLAIKNYKEKKDNLIMSLPCFGEENMEPCLNSFCFFL